MQAGRVDTEQLLETIARQILAYKGHLAALRNDISGGELDVRATSVAGTYTARTELRRLIAIAEEQEVNFAPHTSLERIRDRETELAAERERLLAEVGTERTLHQLVAALRTHVSSYIHAVNGMVHNWEQLATSEYQEFYLEEQAPLIMMLAERDQIDLLMRELPADRLADDLLRKLIDTDNMLRRNGSQLLGPLLNSGVLQRGRQALFEPRERFWHYVDEVKE